MNRNDQSLEILLSKIRVIMSRDLPERGAAIAAIDTFLHEHGHRWKENDDRLINDDSHVEDIGLDERTCHALDAINVWFVGQLRILTHDQLVSGVKVGTFMIMQIIKCLDNHGVAHAISASASSSDGSSSESGEYDPAEDLANRLLESWLEPRAVEA